MICFVRLAGSSLDIYDFLSRNRIHFVKREVLVFSCAESASRHTLRKRTSESNMQRNRVPVVAIPIAT